MLIYSVLVTFLNSLQNQPYKNIAVDLKKKSSHLNTLNQPKSHTRFFVLEKSKISQSFFLTQKDCEYLIMSSKRCAACKQLRRRCPSDCIFLPYFPPNNTQRFSFVHRIYGASNVGKMLQVTL